MSAVSPKKKTKKKASNNGKENGEANGNGKRRRKVTAESMAKSQRDISVSEFFAKNRHLLGFDNPRKALLTTIKEAVDNSLDACEEASIVPEIWVHIETTRNNRFKVGIQDNGPGIMKKQIPLIFGKLLYGSKFHRLRMSRGQQGIGISAAGMYGMLTTGKPVKIISKTSIRKPSHYYEIQIDTKKNRPDILKDVEVKPGERGHKEITRKGIEWVTHYDPESEDAKPKEVRSGTRVTIELEAHYKRGRGSVDEYLEQTAIANPHVTLHYLDPEGELTTYSRSTRELPREPKEIKPHPYGVELGRLMSMLSESKDPTVSQFLSKNFSRVSSSVARKICEGAGVSTRSSVKKIGRDQADAIYQSIQTTKISPPKTDCISPIGEELILKGLHQVVPGEFYVAATRPPAVYRGNPFQIEVGLAYGGTPAAQKVSLEVLTELLGQTDARTLRQFIIHTFNGLGPEAADKILKAAKMGTRLSPGKLKADGIAQLSEAMQNINLSDGQAMQVLRFANRVPLQFQPKACAISQAITNTNWRSYGLSQSRGGLPNGPVSVMVHMASVWVPFTSESKEAIASYPEIEKELRLALQAVGRKLGMYLRRRVRVKKEGERRKIFLRYLGEVATAVSGINQSDRGALYDNLMKVANKATAEADVVLDERGKPVDEPPLDLGDNVLIVDQEEVEANMINRNTKTDNQGKLF